MRRPPSHPRRATAAVLAAMVAVTGLVAPPQASADVPVIPEPVTYDKYQPVLDPGSGAADYFQPLWYDTQGRHIQAHGGQIVPATQLGIDPEDVVGGTQPDGTPIYYWYGEDRSNGYYESPGVSVYSSTDSLNWKNEGVALRSVTTREELKGEYFDAVYDTVSDAGVPNDELIDDLFFNLNVAQSTEGLTAIFERPKALYNAKDDTWVMWWHSDGQITEGGSTYARSMAGVAVSDSPTGPFRMTGAYRLYNREDYKACITAAVPGQARDMTVYQEDDGSAYILYSSEENRSLYVAELDDSYTNLAKTSTVDPVGIQYSADGRYPYLFADGKAGAPVRGEDFSIVLECGSLESPAAFKFDGRYYIVASGTTGWSPNPNTYYSSDSLMGPWIRGVVADDVHEKVAYNTIPEGGDGLLSVGDSRRSTFGSQSTHVFPLDAAQGKFVYMGDRWNAGAANSSYVWLPLTIGENGRIDMRNPATEDPARWGDGWDDSYWDTHGAGPHLWSVTNDGLPATLSTDADFTEILPGAVSVTSNGATVEVPVTWDTSALTNPGRRTIVGSLAAGNGFTAGRQFQRTVEVVGNGLYNIASSSTPTASSRSDLVMSTIDGNLKGKGWDDWVSGGAYPLRSTLTYTWNSPRTLDAIQVHTFRDSSRASWPSKIGVEYLDSLGAWVDSGKFATLVQDASQPAPTARVEVAGIPATTAIRLVLTTDTAVWQSISEVEIFGWASDSRTQLTGLLVDGQSVANFSPSTWRYDVAGKDPATSVVSATAAAGVDVTVAQATAENPVATITVTKNGPSGAEAIGTYRVVLDGAGGCTPVATPWLAVAGNTGATQFCEGPERAFTISDNNGGAWTTEDSLSVIHRDQVVATGQFIATTVDAVELGGNSDPRAGLVLRNDLSVAGKKKAAGYVVLASSPTGVFLQWDNDGNGFIDSEGTATTASWPVELKLEYTSADTATGFWRKNATDAWQVVGTAPLRNPTAVLDAGMFASGNNRRGTSTASFSDTTIGTSGPTVEPSEEPSVEPSEEPSAEPTEEPSAEPTEEPSAEPTEEPSAEPTEEPSAEPSTGPTQEPTGTPTVVPTATTTPRPSPGPGPTKSPTPVITAAPTLPSDDIYGTPGHHYVNGRHWFTTCEPYSQTVRCRTDIVSTQVVRVGGRFVSETGWHFNNLTYLPLMTRAQWSSNPLGHDGSFTSGGRKWRTECDTAATGRGGCRSFIWMTDVVEATRTSGGSHRYTLVDKWVFNNMVRFSRG